MEKILCAAIWYKDNGDYPHQPINIEKGYVWCGRRHHNIINLRGTLLKENTRGGNSIQGFLTNKDRFVDRLEAMSIAINANQLINKDPRDQLYSEDLY